MRLSSYDRDLWALAVPALGALIAEPLYVLADTAIVGHLGTTPLGGLAISSSALLMIYGLCFFLAYGTTATVARLTGAKEDRKAATQSVQSLWLAAILGICLAIAGYCSASPLLQAMGARGEILIQARIYLRVSMYGVPAMLIMIAGVGYLRGLKDTVRPLWVSVGTAILNLVLESILVYGFGLEIGASAASTVVAQWVGALIYLIWIRHAIQPYKIKLTPNSQILVQLLRISGGLFVRNMALTGTFLIATSVAARVGDIDIAAHQVAFQVWFVLAMTMDAMAIAAQALIGNLLGAGKAQEAHRVGQRTIFWSISIGIISGCVVAICRLPLAEIFSGDTAVVNLSGFLILHVALMAPLSGIAFALDGVLIGAGDQGFIAKAMSVSAVITITLMVLTRIADLGIGWLWGAIWIFMGLRSSLLGFRFMSGRWKILGSVYDY
ncbi:MAG: MATE family efflux transporter [Acidimicrobiales bacterium]|jgi:putative MATE family efflux protein|nr:MATE family efflux transporter [Acidimicrobiales bacterium]MDP6297865.1 MATE family efflux transporter [Acidimicrobiales bacterium]HJL64247.1 MATE family efflux transporter [Candidatus Thalassarchaeaceae archaeon]HJM28824.1 MATE family efflux transporter [Acidimicrobiales bacterium]HJM97802.1 MATE family efflux transporter [Acidimicrobiales bacterium]